ncbi:semaphorin-5B [Maniola jurtina]|uniref:semaphorin-5B n=1 Tax=Maniola jurtina TaxID=191418 RepID=UPI001E68F88A|nr:semaphorin-5B [Maniola jurtina]XP_045779008.1 semaphorin-5B [Maniola jurtina]XP_045779009.1 semaphorin-5B [Maniola jurtina]XP_045779010.1 semaphorin-5B [Maniola jurtina]XP_045779011.1 semaphorin-5B [Maniola jurtina]XP_045779012.1 semaphorin-5B [Maniola jurtina]
MFGIYKVAAIIFLGALSNGELPEDDFRIINRQDLLASDSDIFEDKDGKSFSQLLFDVARDQVIVGARDALYRLSLRGLRPLERADWLAPPEKAQLCQDKGQTEEDCHNYIKVLLAYGHKLFACGTNAFSPICSWREIESLSLVSEWVSGVANCPHNPHSNVTAIFASSGEYYAGTPTDFTSSDTAICRSRGASPRKSEMLRTTQYDFNWLNEPQFVGSFEDESFIYFVFREIAVEYLNCGKTIYSRIARVCKNDSGGHLVMKDNWSTFLKARLKCPVPGDLPFYYDEVQSVEYLAQEKILVAVFTTPTNSIAGSAVCIYNMSDIHMAFEGPYKVQDSPMSTWEPRSPSRQAREHFRCNSDTRSHQTIEYHNYHLMYESIQPISGEPVYKATLERFTHVTVDVTNTKNVVKQLVVFVATQKNDIMKLAILPRYEGACVVETWRLRDGKEGFNIQTMQFVKDTMSIYIGSDKGVLRIGSERCSRYKTRSSCVGAVDPHCGWDDARELCVRAAANIHEAYFIQSTASCPTVSTPVDGGWSSWSDWEQCMQDGTPHAVYGDDKPDMCMCRTRRCDNPRAANGGQNCQGASIAVANCTIHGGWSAWSGWSECSASCGIAVKSRRRSCTSPEPKFGGRVCVGFDVQDMYCANLPPCPDPALAPVDGSWSPWGTWSPCTGTGCGAGAGMKERRRVCGSPAPKHGGADCDGPRSERQPCDLRQCELRKATAWTPWVQIPSNSSDGSYMEKRFKFLCKAPTQEQIRLSLAREEERYCNARGTCSSTPPEEDAAWEPWGPWGACSAACGGGQQSRMRRCRRPPCEGSADMLRACNTHACVGEWSCWSEWSACSGGCEEASTGHRSRTRMCLSPEGCADAGAALERRICVNTCAETEVGWGPWGEWGECESGERIRRRSCEAGACVGAQLQVARCTTDDAEMDNELHAMPAYSQNVEMASFVTLCDRQSLSIAGIIGCVITAFVAGCLVCLAGVIACQRRGPLPWNRQPRVPSSPHYITAKQNSYVTVPLKEVPRKAKRQPSFSGIGNTSGILLSKSNNLSNANHNNAMTTPKLYPKAIANEYDSMGTLRRHSNQPNNKTNLDIEEDKFY